ncbi:hypothetical protein ACTXGL_09665 [Psychrobacter sp. T6-6]|uniref:hypothetical protein n=1 Tax=Psychrobacter sp. T6-6 TaxID=3457452 RepID=UPI003FD4A40A
MMKTNFFDNVAKNATRIANSYANSAINAAKSYLPIQDLRKMYGEVRAHEILLQCMYVVTIEDIYGIGGGIPWFTDQTLSYLVTEADLSLGSADAESFYAGALPASYLTQKTADEMDMTFIETSTGEIFKSFRACYDLAFNKDGTVNVPKDYCFKLTIGLINHKKPHDPPAVTRSWIVAAKSGRAETGATGRSEVVKESITFQKMRPLIFER